MLYQNERTSQEQVGCPVERAEGRRRTSVRKKETKNGGVRVWFKLSPTRMSLCNVVKVGLKKLTFRELLIV